MAAPSLDYLTDTLAGLQAQVEGMRREMEALREQLGEEKPRKEKYQPNYVEQLQFVMPLEYYPNSCRTIKDYFITFFEQNTPSGYYKIQTNTSASSQQYAYCSY